MAELSVKIGADIQDLIKKLNLTEKEFKELALQAAKSGKTIDQVLKESGKGGKNLKQGVEQGAKGMDNLGKSTANAVPTLTSFSQVIQDAPYGIRGVANNITQLTSQFGYLSKSTGGSVNALKALGSSMLGPAGILFAVSAITSLLVSYGDELLSAAGSTNKLAKATAEFLGSAQAEIITLRTLVGIANNKSQSDRVRAEAVEEINKKYGDYLGNLTLEEIGTDAVNASVNRLTRSLIKQAQIRGLNSRIEEITNENSEDLIDNQLKLAEAYKTLESEAKKLAKSDSFYGRLLDESKDAKELISDIGKLANETNGVALPGSYKSAIGDVKNLNSEVKRLKTETAEATKPLEELLQGGLADKLLLDSQAVDAVEGSVVTLEEYKKKQGEILKDSKKLQDLYDSITKDIEGAVLFEEAAENLRGANQTLIGLRSAARDGTDLPVHLTFSADPKDLSDLGNIDFDPLQGIDATVKELEKVEELIKNISKAFPDVDTSKLGAFNSEQLQSYISGLERAKATAGIFADATSSAFSAVAQQLSGFLQTGNAVLDAFVGSLIQSLAQMASTLVANQIMKAILAQKDIGVQQGVSSANAVTIASSAAAALGPAGVIAFPGLLASQLGLVNGAFAAIRAIPAFATGGFSGDNNLIRVNGNETIFRPFELSAMYNALRGGNLGRLNPGVSNGIRDSEQVTEFVLRGQELSVLLKRVEKRR